MPAKKKTLKEKQLEKLQQRIEDMYDGACGYVLDNCEDWVNPEELSRVMPVLKATFFPHDDNRYLFECHNLHRFQSPADAAAFLFEHGARG